MHLQSFLMWSKLGIDFSLTGCSRFELLTRILDGRGLNVSDELFRQLKLEIDLEFQNYHMQLVHTLAHLFDVVI